MPLKLNQEKQRKNTVLNVGHSIMGERRMNTQNYDKLKNLILSGMADEYETLLENPS